MYVEPEIFQKVTWTLYRSIFQSISADWL